jgi:hypothetical protein
MGETAENTGPINGKRRGRPENLKRWRKDVSGNPGGRPKGVFGKEALRQLRKRVENGEMALLQVVAAQIVKAICKGDTRSAEFLRDCVDGRPSANDEARTNIGQVNIVWNGPLPKWAQPQEQPSPLLSPTNEPLTLPK